MVDKAATLIEQAAVGANGNTLAFISNMTMATATGLNMVVRNMRQEPDYNVEDSSLVAEHAIRLIELLEVSLAKTKAQFQEFYNV